MTAIIPLLVYITCKSINSNITDSSCQRYSFFSDKNRTAPQPHLARGSWLLNCCHCTKRRERRGQTSPGGEKRGKEIGKVCCYRTRKRRILRSDTHWPSRRVERILVYGRGGGCVARLFFFFSPVQPTTSGIDHRVNSFFGLGTNTLNE